MAELENPPTRAAALIRTVIFYIGASGLILVMLVETLAVIGRHIAWPFLGAIEIIQAAILVSACAAMVLATVSGVHATVHLLTDHLSGAWKSALQRLAALFSALFFIGLACGATCLANEFWNAQEETELLHISFRPLRVLTAVAVASVVFVFARQLVMRSRKSPQSSQ